ncbi:MAG: CO dehydrogenase/acetyl-CoA synthase complex subunit epsilon [Promethearchaeota archaeon]
MAKAYQKANLPGPDVGVAISDPTSLANIIKRAKHPLVVIGAKSVDQKVKDKVYAEYLYELGQKIGADIVASASGYKYLVEHNLKNNVVNMPVLNLMDRLRDPTWINLKGSGEKYDLVIMAGYLVYFLSQAFSTLKNFTEYRTVCLDRYHQPNARFSLMNLEQKEWAEFLTEMASKL